MILITGATGLLGSAVVEYLMERMPEEKLAILIRSKHKAGDFNYRGIYIRTGNYDDKNSLLKAFEGIGKLLLISGNDLEKRQNQHENVIDTAKEAGVKHVIYTSFDRKKEKESPLGILAESHVQTDRYLKDSGMSYTILRNTLYADALPMFLGDDVLESGIFFPAGDGKVPFATRRDMAEATAAVLADDGHENKEYVFANTRNYSMHDVAEVLSSIISRKVVYHDPPREVYIEELTKAGVPQQAIDMGASFGDAIKSGEFESDHTDMDRFLGRNPTTLKDFLKLVYSPG